MIITIVSISIRLVVIYRMPPSKKNNLIIVGDFNINWLDTSDSERRNLFNILETSGLVQRIELPTYQNGNIFDYIITRQSSDIASNCMVSDKISDHMVLHESLVCQRPHPERK